MLWPYTLNDIYEQLNNLNVDDYGVTPMEKFPGNKTYITLKYQHRWGCPVYVLAASIQK